MKKIIIIDPAKGWGHFVSKIYTYRFLSKYLGSKIVFVTKEKNQIHSYLNEEKFYENTIYLNDDKNRGFKGIIYKIKDNIRVIKEIKNSNISECYIFHPSSRLFFLAYFARVKNIYALGYRFQNFLIKKKYRLYKSFFSKCIPDDNEAVTFVKKITKLNKIDFQPLENSSKYKNSLVGIGIAGSEEHRRWGVENFIEIIKFCVKKNYNNFLIISGKDQKKDEEYIKEKLKKYNLELTFTSNKKIYDVIPYIKRCKFYVGNDTGFAHLLVNYGILSNIIYGALGAIPQYYSDRINAIDINKNIKRSYTSIKTIKVEDVLKKIKFG